MNKNKSKSGLDKELFFGANFDPNWQFEAQNLFKKLQSRIKGKNAC